ncbi:MAG: pilus assembly protein [Hahellaceae bacterium]|nr:pilus assembly protein [Hahellaceae bacterium]
MKLKLALLKNQAGQSVVETLLAAPFVLFLIFGIIEFALIYRAKVTLNHATEMTARAGALNHGCKSAMYDQFARSMTPLLMTGDRSTQRYLTVQTYKDTFFDIYTHIKTLHPTRAVFDAFAEPIPLTAGQIRPCAQEGSRGRLHPYQLNQVIPNDNLSFRDSRNKTINDGQAYQLNLQDANLLKIRIRYCHKLSVPLLDHLIVAVQHWIVSNDKQAFLDYCIRGNGAQGIPVVDEKLLVLTAHATTRMQTPFIRKSLERNR